MRTARALLTRALRQWIEVERAARHAAQLESVEDQQCSVTSARAETFSAELEHAGGAEKAVLVGSRVQFVGLRTTADLNETYGVVLRYDDDCGRYAVRKEIALSGQPHTVTARAANLRSVRPLETLAELPALEKAVVEEPYSAAACQALAAGVSCARSVLEGVPDLSAEENMR